MSFPFLITNVFLQIKSMKGSRFLAWHLRYFFKKEKKIQLNGNSKIFLVTVPL
jgi:hypothetical protein